MRSEQAGARQAGDVDPRWAWTPYEPDQGRPWNLARAGHLFRRAAFGAGHDRLEQALREGPQRTVDRLLRPGADIAAFNRTYDAFESKEARSGSAEGLRAWWLRRMMASSHPVLEKMTLFWHDHFAISNFRVKDACLMQQYLALLRAHALGRFAPLLEALSEDPALLAGLDARDNRRAQPNENLARALLVQFSLGPGQASERDIREAARAFTGQFVLRGRFRFFPHEHDGGEKEILGRRGEFAGRDVVGLVLQHPATSRFLVRKLYRWLIAETDEPSDALIAPLAESFAEGYDIAALVERMLRSNLFFSEAVYRRRIKSPVEFALGIVTPLEGLISTTQLGSDLAAMGQDLCHPPTVGGWEGGRAWINRFTMVARCNLARALVDSAGSYGGRLDPWSVSQRYGHTTVEAAGRFLLDVLMQSDLDRAAGDIWRAALAEPEGGEPAQVLRRFVHGVTMLPEFQLA